MNQLPIKSSLIKGAFFFFLIIFSSSTAFALGKPFDHSLWDQFLQEYVDEQGNVDYAGLSSNSVLLQKYLAKLQGVHLNHVDSWPREEQIAFWLNAYHASVIKVVSDHYPVNTIQEIPSAWDRAVIRLQNKKFSPNQIREAKLLKAFGDEKIHLVLSCGAVGCPKLERRAFTGPEVEGQLYEATRRFVNNPDRNTIDPKRKKVRLSRLFKWHAEDFLLDFGYGERERKILPQEAAVIAFMQYYLDDFEQIKLLDSGDFKLKYHSFDWSLNDSAVQTAR